MAKQVFKYFIITLLIFAGGILEAQVDASRLLVSGWRVYYAEGDILVNQDGVRSVYQGESKELREILLGPRDMIQTGSGKAEIQLIPGTAHEGTYTIVKLSENTSLLADDKPEDGDFTLELLYGRMRVITGTAEPSIAIRTGVSVAALKNCDTAIDYVARPGITQPSLTIHCFSGEGELIPRPGAETAKLPLNANETLFLEYQTPFSYVERKILDNQVLGYWEEIPFTPEAPLPMPLTELAAVRPPESAQTSALARTPEPAPESAQTQQAEQESALTQQAEQEPALEGKPKSGPKEKTPRPPRVARAPKTRHIFAITGMLLAVAGTAVQTYSLLGNPSSKLRDPLFYGSYAPMGVGVIFLLGSAVSNSAKASSGK